MFPHADRSVYRRNITIEPAATVVSGVLQDHHHHFCVAVHHDGTTIVDTDVSAVRSPWDTCGDGGSAIRSMVGLSLDDACNPRSWAADRSLHCTHVADLALLSVRHARDAEPVGYEVRIWPAARTHRVATLSNHDVEVMRWELDGRTVTGPPPWNGVSLDRDVFLPWVRSTLDADGEEHAMILRRASSIAIGNAFDLDDVDVASDVHPPDDTCFTYRDSVAFTARRNRGSSRQLEWS